MPSPYDLSFAITPLVRDTCLCLHVQRAARALARRYDEALRPLGITSGQFSLLMSLHRPSPPSMGEVSAVLAMDRTTLTANLKPLGRRGLVRTVVDLVDKRNRRVMLTAEGRAKLIEALPVWHRTQAVVGDMLGEELAPDRLRADLRKLS
jgi:DNA-binding MarR family transcriptional regulator